MIVVNAKSNDVVKMGHREYEQILLKDNSVCEIK